jgi:hypothetical protein
LVITKNTNLMPQSCLLLRSYRFDGVFLPKCVRAPKVNGHAGNGHGKIGQIHAQAAFGVDRCFRRDVGGGYGNPQPLRLPRAGLATATPSLPTSSPMSNFIAQSLFGIPLVIVITLTLYAAMRALRSPLRRRRHRR